MLISSMKDMPQPRSELEQYRTPASMVCDVLYEARYRNDIIDRRVCELGCGPSPFAIGSWILGAKEVLGVDIDEDAIRIAKENLVDIASRLKTPPSSELEFMVHDVRDPFPFPMQFDTTLMNPPFGAQNKHADRVFIERAIGSSSVCYSIHNGNSLDFLRKMARSMNKDLELLWKDELEIPARYDFHRSEKKRIDVIIIRLSQGSK